MAENSLILATKVRLSLSLFSSLLYCVIISIFYDSKYSCDELCICPCLVPELEHINMYSITIHSYIHSP